MSSNTSMLIAGEQGRKFCFRIADSSGESKPCEIHRVESGDVVVFRGGFLLLRLDYLYRIGHTGIKTIVHLGQGFARILPIGLSKFDLPQRGTELDESVAHVLLHFGLLVFILGLPLTQRCASLLNVRTDLPAVEDRDTQRSRCYKDSVGIRRSGSHGAVVTVER